MYVLFAFDLDGRHFELQCSSWTGEEVLRVDGHPVSARRSFAFDGEHAFALEGMGSLVLRFQIELQADRVHYELWRGDQPLTKDCCAAGQPKWLERLTPRARRSTARPRARPSGQGAVAIAPRRSSSSSTCPAARHCSCPSDSAGPMV